LPHGAYGHQAYSGGLTPMVMAIVSRGGSSSVDATSSAAPPAAAVASAARHVAMTQFFGPPASGPAAVRDASATDPQHSGAEWLRARAPPGIHVQAHGHMVPVSAPGGFMNASPHAAAWVNSAYFQQQQPQHQPQAAPGMAFQPQTHPHVAALQSGRALLTPCSLASAGMLTPSAAGTATTPGAAAAAEAVGAAAISRGASQQAADAAVPPARS
jgi:hypothetical protein